MMFHLVEIDRGLETRIKCHVGLVQLLVAVDTLSTLNFIHFT